MYGVLQYGVATISATLVILTTVFCYDFSSSRFKSAITRRKFNYNITMALYYSCVTVWATWIAISTKFDVTSMLKEYDMYDPGEYAFIIYYAAQIGFYLFSICVALSQRDKMSDYNRLIFHHFLTLSLILTSLYGGYWRIGFMILLLHDASDIPLYLAKATQYHFRETGRLESLTSLLFGIFVFGFIIARIILFPLFVIHPAALSDIAICQADSFRYITLFPEIFSDPFWMSKIQDALTGPIQVFYELPLAIAGVKDTGCITFALASGWGLCLLYFLQLTWLIDIFSHIFKVKDEGIRAEDVRSDNQEDSEALDRDSNNNKLTFVHCYVKHEDTCNTPI